jgi:hypothetical protein
MKFLTILISLFVLLIGAAMLAWVQVPNQVIGVVCREELKTHCPGLEIPMERLWCLRDLNTSLKGVCRYVTHKRIGKEYVKTFRAACYEDTERVCKDEPPGEGKIFACLLGNYSAVGKHCQEFLFEASCTKDVRLFCQWLFNPEDKATADCLVGNRAKLSADCRYYQDFKDWKQRQINPVTPTLPPTTN